EMVFGQPFSTNHPSLWRSFPDVMINRIGECLAGFGRINYRQYENLHRRCVGFSSAR
ncbi:hypothetical protein TorRG33x02_348280, partial [Trema orientale]